jgi:CTP:molybdopterin cytidylyltransferase MocA
MRDDALIVTPVDMLPAEARTLHALLACLTGEALAVTPLYGGRGGHPVIARRAVLASYEAPIARAAIPLSLALPLPSLREVLHELADRRLRVEVDDPRVLGDLDTPSDVRALRRTAC